MDVQASPRRNGKNAGRGGTAAGIARKWEGERRGTAADYRARSSPCQATGRLSIMDHRSLRFCLTPLIYDSPLRQAN